MNRLSFVDAAPVVEIENDTELEAVLACLPTPKSFDYASVVA